MHLCLGPDFTETCLHRGMWMAHFIHPACNTLCLKGLCPVWAPQHMVMADVNRGHKIGGPSELTSDTELVSDVNRGEKNGGPGELSCHRTCIRCQQRGPPVNSPLSQNLYRMSTKGAPGELTSVTELVSDVAASRGVQGGLSGQQDTRQGD